MELMRRLIREEEGQGYLEYAVLIALVVIVVAVAAGWIGGAIQNYMNAVSRGVQAGVNKVNNLGD